MMLIDTLQDEHVLIDRVLGSCYSYLYHLHFLHASSDDDIRLAAFFTEFAVTVRSGPS